MQKDNNNVENRLLIFQDSLYIYKLLIDVFVYIENYQTLKLFFILPF